MNRLFKLKIREKKCSPSLIYLLSVIALIIFLYGFFPLNYSKKVTSNGYRYNVTNNVRSRCIDKLALIIIDALRYDFVVPQKGQQYMPFTTASILNNEGCYTVTKAHSPTVTLPRLKAITSGSISTYFDVVLNFMAPAFEEDNFIKTAVSNGLRLVFYGDETWLKLFPDSFIRSEGTNSFFTYDYVEVDNNVTRHIDDELRKNDWDIIILHYLGLDHIGHTEGPKSPLVKSKLLEMDGIIKHFYDHFKQLENNQSLKTMLIVTGDHGMKDSGSHGGVTYPEINVPLVSIGSPCVTLHGWPEDHIPLQIDLAPTLSTIFGLPIPANNMGKIIPSLLLNMNQDDILKNLEINRLELKLKFKTDKEFEFKSDKTEMEDWLLKNYYNEEDKINLTKKYFHCLNRMSQELVLLNSDYKIHALIFGVIALWIFLIWLIYKFLKESPKPENCIHWFFIIGTILHGISLFSSSFIEEEHQTWYFLWITFLLFTFLEAFYFRKYLSVFHCGSFFISWIILAFTHRILRKLNQTGDKWAFLPDMKFYLYLEEGQPWLFFVFLLGIAMVLWCAFYEGCSKSQLLSYGICVLAVAGYRIASGNFKLEYLHFSSRGVIEVFIFWIFITVFLVQTIFNKTPFYLVWLLFISLLLRPHNVILLAVEVFTSKQLYKFFSKSESKVWNCIAHIWLGNVFYFYQGNGNSLSNVDVAAGFVGIQKYIPLYAGIMLTAHTYNSQILSYILSPKSDLVCALSRIIPVTLYCTAVIFQLNHLFIWSVFSPKLLYESSTTLVFLLLFALNNLSNFWNLLVK